MKTKVDIISNPVYQKPLRKGHSLAVHSENDSDIVRVRNAKGLVLFTIEVSNKGATLNIEAENISIAAKNKLHLSAEEVNISSQKQLFVKSEGSFNQYVRGNKTIETQGENYETAKTQCIKASLGDIKLTANDDIKLNGERVKLNCD